MSVLDEIIDGVRVDLAEREMATPLDRVKEAARRVPEAMDPMPAFRADGVSVIAEVKRSSPSKGVMASIADPAEVHDEEEVDRALDAGAELLGVNARNLKTLDVDRDTFARLAPRIPDHVVRVAESGVRGPHDVFEYAKQGANVVLVGESLVKGDDPRAAVADLVAAGAHPALKQQRD